MLTTKNLGDIVTFSRASSAWSFSSGGVLVQSAADVPRLDYDPLTLAVRGLLLERSLTNLCTYSEFPNGVSDAPVRGGPVAAEAIYWLGYFTKGLSLGWDGVTDAYAYKTVALSPSTSYMFSLFVRMDDGNAPSFGSATGSDVSNDFSMVVGSSTIGPNSFAVEALRDGVFRVAGMLTTSASPGTNLGIVKYRTNSSRTFKFTGYQIVASAYLGSYMPTLGAQATRAYDSAVITDLSRIGFNPAEGTLYAEYIVPKLGSTAGALNVNDGTSNYRMSIISNSGNQCGAYVNVGGASFYLIQPDVLSAGAIAKCALAYRADGYAFSSNGKSAVVGGAGTGVPSVNRLVLGSTNLPGSEMLNSCLRNVRYIPRRITNTELQALTA